MKKLAAISVSALMILLLVGLMTTPASAQYPPTQPRKPTCNVGDTTLSPGDQVTVTGKHWQPGSTVRFTLQPEDMNLGSTTVGTNGKFSTVLTIPNNIVPGPHTIQCSGLNRRGVPVVRAITIQIVAGVVAGGGGTSFTGTILNVPLWMLLMAALFAAGVTAVALGRRRKRGVRTGS